MLWAHYSIYVMLCRDIFETYVFLLHKDVAFLKRALFNKLWIEYTIHSLLFTGGNADGHLCESGK